MKSMNLFPLSPTHHFSDNCWAGFVEISNAFTKYLGLMMPLSPGLKMTPFEEMKNGIPSVYVLVGMEMEMEMVMMTGLVVVMVTKMGMAMEMMAAVDGDANNDRM